MTYQNNCKQINIKVGDYILTKDYQLLKVKKILTNGILTINDVEVDCDEILDVKKWDEWEAENK